MNYHNPIDGMNRTIRDFIHRHVWQRLPRGPRRAALSTISQFWASKISVDANPCEPIIVAGPLRAATGLGQSSRLCYEAFRACGLNVFGVDLSAALGQPLDFADYAFVDGAGLRGRGTIILHVNSPFVPLAIISLGRQLVEAKWIVGYWAWELPRAPNDWRDGVPFVHEIWVPSTFTATAVRAVAGGKRVSVLPHPVAIEAKQASRKKNNSDSDLTVLVAFNMASGFTRKNPLASITAFKAAFGRDARRQLVIKVSHMDSYPEGSRALLSAVEDLPNAKIIDRTISTSAMNELYERTNAIMSLHRSEGFGLVVAEAMLAALPAISTDWSSTTDFLTVENGLPVKYNLIPASDPQGTYDDPSQLWADADVDDAAGKLASLGSPSERKRIGEAAQTQAKRLFSADAYVNRALELLAPAGARTSFDEDPR